MIINQNILAILRTFLNLKKNYEKLYTKRTSTAATTEFVWKIPTRKKKSSEHFSLFEAEISLDKIIKSINSKTNNKPPGNDGLTEEFYKHFSNGLAPALLGVYDSWGKLNTMGVLLIEKESYLPSRPYLGQITSEKQVSTQNEKYPNRDMQNYLKSSK